MSLRKVSADEKKKLIMIELKKEIVDNRSRGVCVVDLINKPIELKHVNNLHFICS